MAMNNNQKGHPQTEATKKKISQAEKGRTLSAETKAKISKSLKGNKNAAK
ncbi:hypothetical protein LJB76_02935 [Clostridia bacterium OttesenSCG-928-O13]|nr:hypothetical protein [Clostridia bacterium OttesenSCG-928-O13]